MVPPFPALYPHRMYILGIKPFSRCFIHAAHQSTTSPKRQLLLPSSIVQMKKLRHGKLGPTITLPVVEAGTKPGQYGTEPLFWPVPCTVS